MVLAIMILAVDDMNKLNQLGALFIQGEFGPRDARAKVQKKRRSSQRSNVILKAYGSYDEIS